MKFLIFSQFWPRLDQAVQIGPIFARMAHQASEGWIFAWTMASGLKILIVSPACSGSCGGLPISPTLSVWCSGGSTFPFRWPMQFQQRHVPRQWSECVLQHVYPSFMRAALSLMSITNSLSLHPQAHCSGRLARCTMSRSSRPRSLGHPTRPR